VRVYTPSDRVLKKGETFLVDAGALYEDCWVEFSRMAVVGRPDRKQSEMHQLVVNVLEKVTEAVRPGIKPSELVTIYRREFETRAFYSIESEGLTLPMFWNSQNSIFPIVLVLHRKCFSDDAHLFGIEIQ
jgi:Xaa-Pro aminopeptidase